VRRAARSDMNYNHSDRPPATSTSRAGWAPRRPQLARLLLLSALLAACCIRTASSEGWDTKQCQHSIPAQYALAHAGLRGKPAARYIVYTCKDHRDYGCYGMGDRMRAILFLMRLAIATSRVLLVDWTFPTDLRKHLVPNLINWSTEGLDVPPLAGYPDDEQAAPGAGSPGRGAAAAAAAVSKPSSLYIPLTSTVPWLANISTLEGFNASYGQQHARRPPAAATRRCRGRADKAPARPQATFSSCGYRPTCLRSTR
jgi:hypothetical protein